MIPLLVLLAIFGVLFLVWVVAKVLEQNRRGKAAAEELAKSTADLNSKVVEYTSWLANVNRDLARLNGLIESGKNDEALKLIDEMSAKY